MADPTPTPKSANGQTTEPATTPAETKPADMSKEQAPAAGAAPAAPKEEKLSGAELKKRAKAEKAAKRAAEKAAKDAAGGGAPQPSAGSKKQEGKQKEQKGGQQNQQGGGPRGGQQQDRPLPMRRRPSQSGPAGGPVKEVKSEKKKHAEKQVGLFGHLYGQPRRHEIEGAAKEVHPAILALGLQMSSYVICGSNARTVAMLLAFKSVIESYTTPPGTSLARHLTSHHLSPQISHLSSCRPLSVSQGNAIRWLKDLIIKVDPSVPETTAKSHLLAHIDTFIREKFTAADEVISESASTKIVDGDVVVTFAKSSIVLKTLLRAHADGRKFRVNVVDSKPLFEGKQMARSLAAAGIQVSYTLVGAASHAVKEASKVFLGASAMMSNGRLYSRVGTAIIAMFAHERDIPVIVCCESVKFTERVALDSIVNNEIAPADEILGDGEWIGEGLTEEDGEAGAEKKGREGALKKWKETPHLQLLNVLYDVTPAEYVKMVVTEMGSLPPSSVPVVHRISTSV
ncbi:translation initiation factor eif-2b delta subunit [Diplodia corticola]|uniref:Translation initiation factor eIF2B subunit delta n=1 Tax=Diplodia corticola TaxID=236234 RepID=A0A1J9QNS4_9PEZI|nr:translation initiation factor eif-2b delta subunit [Diplodia corticola]OJD29706.1 translation initiation factor eif-2b delta subunit [Diplodia corticola]